MTVQREVKTMPQVWDKEEIVRRGQEIYETRLRALLEEGNRGKFLVINTETGDYELDDSDMAAGARAHSRHPLAPLFFMRVGHAAAYHLKGRIKAL